MITNIPLARKVLEYAEIEHEDFEFEMSNWVAKVYTDGRPRDSRGRFIKGKVQESVCKTSACLAGTAVHLDPDSTIVWSDSGFGGPGRSSMVVVDGREDTMHNRARDLLGITNDEAHNIFYVQGNKIALRRFRRMIEEAERQEYKLSGVSE